MYCFKCRKETGTVNSTLVTTANNRLLSKGICEVCGTKKARFQKSRKGSGVLNTMINKLPVELHIPGYNYCGPGTKLAKRLARADPGINALDEACKKHDVAYAEGDDLDSRHKADEKLASEALKVSRDPGSSLGERLAAVGVAGAMKAKVKLGMGVL